MSERDKLRQHILDHFHGQAGVFLDYAYPIVDHVMHALDSWIEEQQPQEEEIKVGDKVSLKKQLKNGDGSLTDKQCEVAEPMESIHTTKIGEVVNKDSGVSSEHVEVDFGSYDEWWFHVDDLKKVHT